MTAGVRDFRQQEIVEMEQRIQMFYQTAQKDIQAKQQEFMVPIQQKMMDAVKKVAEAQGCDYVLEAMTLHYVSPSALDLMPLVKKELGIQ
jgi:outer membrane protein